MIKVIRYFSIIILFGAFAACTQEADKTPDQLCEEAREALTIERTKLMNASGEIDTNRANAIIEMYITFVQNNPNDIDAAEFMFQAASLCMGKGDYQRAIRLFENVKLNYREDKRAPEAYFLIAFIYENNLNQRGAAEDAYKLVISEFPRHDYSLQARAAIKNMNTGKTDLELVRMFEEQNNPE